jgi:hypothetical protein
LGKRDIRLIEIPKEVEKKLKSSDGCELQILGSEDALNAVLCTDDQTFSIKKVETSNTVCLVPPVVDSEHILSDIYSVVATCPCFYELKQTSPNFDEVEKMLRKSLYRGIEAEKEYPPKEEDLLSYQDIQNMALASRKELDKALKEFQTVEIDGKIRIMSKDAKWSIAKQLMNEIILADFDIEKLSDAELRDVTRDDPIDFMLYEHTLNTLGTLDAEGFWCLEAEKLAQTAAHIIFREKNDEFILIESFMENWELKLPKGVKTDSSLLGGIALAVTRGGTVDNFYTYAPFAELGSTNKCRLAAVFKIKSKLTKSELRPYISVDSDATDATKDDIITSLTRKVDEFYVPL